MLNGKHNKLYKQYDLIKSYTQKKTGKKYRKISVVVSRYKYYEWFWFSFYIL